jgi:hypothetical protein
MPRARSVPAALPRPTRTPSEIHSYLTMRNDAFREADLIIIFGTGTNHVIGHVLPARFSAAGKTARFSILET